ncbi:MAG: 50S ribosomal protein L24 [Verrucomicrobia bacterium]|nr:50S ribosomal protein L24 [Verrucomicrobiota bacterium]
MKKGDDVVAISGVSAGRTGKVLFVDSEKGRAIVEGINLKKKTVRRSQDNPQGGIIDQEAPIALSNLMPYDPQAKKGVRVSRAKDGDKPIRKSKASSHVFD